MAKRKGMSRTMRQEEASAIRAALKGKPSPVEPSYQRFIERHQGQQRLPFTRDTPEAGK